MTTINENKNIVITHNKTNYCKSKSTSTVNNVTNSQESFLSKFRSIFCLSKEQKNRDCQLFAKNFLLNNFSIQENATEVIEKNNEGKACVSYIWKVDDIETFIPTGNELFYETPMKKQENQENKKDYHLTEQFIKDFDRIRYSASLPQSPKLSLGKLEDLTYLFTVNDLKDLTSIAHQGHLADSTNIAMALYKNDDYLVVQSKNKDDLKINIEKTEKNEYIIKSSCLYKLRNMLSEGYLSDTKILVERSTYIQRDSNNNLIQNENSYDDIIVKVSKDIASQ